MAKGAIDSGIPIDHQPVKGIVAVIAIIFEYWHDIYLLVTRDYRIYKHFVYPVQEVIGTGRKAPGAGHDNWYLN
jgi:hypothetical protein